MRPYAGAVLLGICQVLLAVVWWVTPSAHGLPPVSPTATAPEPDPAPGDIEFIRVFYRDGTWADFVVYDAPAWVEPTPETWPTEVPLPTATSDLPVRYGRVTAVNGLNVRAGPDGNAARLGALPYGHCTRLNEESGGWWRIDYAGQEGWISGVWVQVLDVCPVVWVPSPTPTAMAYMGQHAIPTPY